MTRRTWLVLALAATGCRDAGDMEVELEPREIGAPSHPQGDFIPPPDDMGGGSSYECSFYVEDCPPGDKCMPWANDGGGAWNATICRPLANDPGGPGDPCVVEGNGVSGIDDCGRGMMCWDVDQDTLEGYCVPFVRGSESNPLCEDPFRYPSISGSGAIALCLDLCDPLAQDCAEGQACYALNDTFACAPDVSGKRGGLGEQCEFVNVCDAGLVCLGAQALPECESAGCCTPFCDVTEPVCPEGLECEPWFEQATFPGSENVGVCVGA